MSRSPENGRGTEEGERKEKREFEKKKEHESSDNGDRHKTKTRRIGEEQGGAEQN